MRITFSVTAACFTVAVIALTTFLSLPAQAAEMSTAHTEHNSMPAILSFIAFAAAVGFVSSLREKSRSV